MYIELNNSACNGPSLGIGPFLHVGVESKDRRIYSLLRVTLAIRLTHMITTGTDILMCSHVKMSRQSRFQESQGQTGKK